MTIENIISGQTSHSKDGTWRTSILLALYKDDNVCEKSMPFHCIIGIEALFHNF